jgi:hypothetical protein
MSSAGIHTTETVKLDETVKTELALLTDIIITTVPVKKIYLFGSYPMEHRAYGTPKEESVLITALALQPVNGKSPKKEWRYIAENKMTCLEYTREWIF